MKTRNWIWLLFFVHLFLFGEESKFSYELADRAVIDRNATIQLCITCIKEKKILDPQLWGRAAEILGELRAKEAIEVLLENIAKLQSFKSTEPGGQPYVAVEALEKIGKEVCLPCLRKLASGKCTQTEINFIGKILEHVEPNKVILELRIAELDEHERASARKLLAPFLKNWGKNWADAP